MKKKLLFGFAAVLALAACQKESGTVIDGEDNGEKFYLSFTVQTAQTKSSTEDDGTSDANPDIEVGTADENAIGQIIVNLKPEGTGAAVVSQEVQKLNSTDAANSGYVASFKSKSIAAGVNYRAYITVNQPGAAFDPDQVLTAASGVLKNQISESGKFFMSSTGVDAVNTFSVTEAQLKAHKLPTNPLVIGNFNVERAAARFDFKPVNGNVYTLTKDKTTGNAIINLELKDMALVNVSKSFYQYKRVAADLSSETGAVLGGSETKTNYVVDADWNAKKSSDAAASTALFDYPYNYQDETGYDWTAISAVTASGREDNWTGAAGDYYRWTYATENTIPSMAQNKAQTTGVAFRGELQTTADCPAALKAVVDAGTEAIYVFADNLYGTWTMVEDAAAAADASYALKAAVTQINNVSGTASDADYAAANFKVFRPNAGKYQVLYYYWNRHNDNNDPAVMGPMEFAVVRNNVYKLAVTSISRYGHPSKGGVDPDPETPDQPDESEESYFTVDLTVLPWSVRINDIEF